MRGLILIGFLAAVAGGCAKEDAGSGGSGKGPPKMKVAEMDRATEMCDRYVERLCRCATTDPTLAGDCELARSQPAGLAMHVGLLKGARGPLNDEERRISEGNVRDFLQACVDADLALEPTKCPRTSAE